MRKLYEMLQIIIAYKARQIFGKFYYGSNTKFIMIQSDF